MKLATDAQRLANARNTWTARAQHIQRTASKLRLAAAAQWPVLPAGVGHQGEQIINGILKVIFFLI